MENKVLVFLYKRDLIEENEEDYVLKSTKKDKTKIYSLKPIDIIEGKIKNIDGSDIFYSSDGKFEIKRIDDLEGIEDEFVFAFDINVEKYTKKDIKQIIEVCKSEELWNTYLLQAYNEKHPENIFAYAHNIYSHKFLVLIDSYSYDDSLSTLIYDVTDIKIKSKSKYPIIINRSFIDEIKRIKEINTKRYEQEKERYETFPHKSIKYSNKNVYSDELYDEIRKYVISQDEAIKTIATIFAKNQRIDNPYMKTNFLLCGPTGVGKTEIFRQLSKIANVPMITEDATEFTASGYVGRSVIDILYKLYNAAEQDLVKAENGIVMIDEIDKKAGFSGDMEVTKGSVIQSLLKMIEGHTYELEIGKKIIYFDTSRVTFAFSGAFSDIKDGTDKKQIGFKNDGESILESNEKKYNFENLSKYGLLPEFLGRNRIITMKSLSEEDLEKILRTSKLSYLKLYREYLRSINIKFEYNKKVLQAIAKKAIKQKAGARSLQSISENALEVADYYVTSKKAKQYTLLRITPQTIEDNTKFILR